MRQQAGWLYDDEDMGDLDVAIEAAKAGGAVVAAHFGAAPEPEFKSKFDPVTAVDRESEAAVIATINKRRPADPIMAEEGGGTRHADRHWIVDPLDGTVNFVHGLPHISVSVALYSGDTGLVGVVFDPLRDELFVATSGGGATLNGQEIRVSQTRELERAIVATGFPYDHDVKADDLAVTLREVLRRVAGIRRMGSAALDLAWVACGRYDAYWEFGIAPWDGAAGHILVREAGGMVTDPTGSDSTPSMGQVVAANQTLHPRLRAVVEQSMGPSLRSS